MSTEDDIELAELPVSPEVQQVIKRLTGRVDDLESRLASQREGLKRAHDENDRLAEELERRDETIGELRQEITDLKERTDLQRFIEDASKLKVEERASVCIQTCVNEARRREKGGQSPRATMDYNGAKKALGGGLADQQLLDALERAGDLVHSEAVRFKKEKRSAKKNSRLVVDLEAGDLPSKYDPTSNHGREE